MYSENTKQSSNRSQAPLMWSSESERCGSVDSYTKYVSYRLRQAHLSNSITRIGIDSKARSKNKRTIMVDYLAKWKSPTKEYSRLTYSSINSDTLFARWSYLAQTSPTSQVFLRETMKWMLLLLFTVIDVWEVMGKTATPILWAKG